MRRRISIIMSSLLACLTLLTLSAAPASAHFINWQKGAYLAEHSAYISCYQLANCNGAFYISNSVYGEHTRTYRYWVYNNRYNSRCTRRDYNIYVGDSEVVWRKDLLALVYC